MPYTVVGNCVKKKNADGSGGETVPGGCHDTHDEAVKHLQALEANVKDSAIAEFSMRITKAAYNKSERSPMKWNAIDSDVDEDLYTERMSLELYQDFEKHIKNNEEVPETFKSVICEDDWCGGMPYLSIAHYKSGSEKRNVPGEVEAIFIDGTRLKSKGILHDTPMGRKVFDALREDLYMEKSGNSEHRPVRISIGFLDLEHKHRSQNGGQEFTFERTELNQSCPLCDSGVGGKIYTKGHLIHLAMTRVPVNPRTEMSVEKSMDEITSKRKDAESIIGELADGLEEKSIPADVLVVRSDTSEGIGTRPVDDEDDLQPCYDPNTDSYDQACVDSVMDKYVGKFRKDATVKSTVDKALLDAVSVSLNKLYKSNGYNTEPIVEEAMATQTVEKNMDKEHMEEEEKDEKKEEKSVVAEVSSLDKSYNSLKSILSSAKSADEVQRAFNEFGAEVEKSYTPPAANVNDIAEIVTRAVAAAVQPLQLELATIKAKLNGNAVSSDVVKSKALTLSGYTRPEDMIQRSIPQQPARKLTQIERLAMKSTGALRE